MWAPPPSCFAGNKGRDPCLVYPKARHVYPICIPSDSLLKALADLDRRVAREIQAKPCPHCGGPLHSATWTRKPRGAALPEELAERWGLCCGHCRRRTLPPSVLFAGRRVYLKAVLLLVVAARQRGRERTTLRQLRTLFGASADTIRRWIRAFRERLPTHPAWRATRGQIPPTVRDSEVPGGLLDLLLQNHDADTALSTACRQVPAL